MYLMEVYRSYFVHQKGLAADSNTEGKRDFFEWLRALHDLRTPASATRESKWRGAEHNHDFARILLL